MIKVICYISFLIFIASPQFDSKASIYTTGVGGKLYDHHVGATLNLDLSKSYVSGYVDFSQRKLEARELSDDFKIQNEIFFYAKQFKETLRPKYFLVEADLYPLSALGPYLHDNEGHFYRKFDVDFKNSTINPIELAASRFEQPYSFSLFIGDIFPFVSKGGENKEMRQSGSAVMGHVFTFGDKRLIKIHLEKNKWFQYSYKIKGTNSTNLTLRKWKFEVGYIYNEKDLFYDALVFNLTRDYASKIDDSFLSNMKIEYSFNIPLKRVEGASGIKQFTTFQKIIFGRNFPFKKFILKLDFGAKWEQYKLPSGKKFSELSYIVGPDISW